MKLSYPLSLLVLLITFLSCRELSQQQSLRTGPWLGELKAMDEEILPFTFELQKTDGIYKMWVNNAEEVIVIEDIEIDKDSITIRMPVYEGYIKGRWSETEISGSFIKESLDRIVPFYARFGSAPRFEVSAEPISEVDGVWEADFSANTEDFYKAKGIFKQSGAKVTGTFRTNKGDYRYLEGVLSGDSLRLSAFDGAHAFLFVARVEAGSMEGIFYSGNHFKEPFTARINEAFELPDADELTFLKEGYDSLDFSFPNAAGEVISLSDPDFADKVVVVQIMGTWCPNCMDETRFLVEYLKEHNHPDLRIVALAFEYARTEESAFAGIDRLKQRIGVTYPVLLAQYGSSSKIKANEKLPMLNHVLSYPTTIFLNKLGQVSKIHTGFNGPATGNKYLEFKQEFADEIRSLLSE